MSLSTFIKMSRTISILALSTALIACSTQEQTAPAEAEIAPLDTETKKTARSEFGQLSVELQSPATQLTPTSTSEEIEKLINVRTALIKLQGLKAESAELYRIVIVDGKYIYKTLVTQLVRDEKKEIVDTFRLVPSSVNVVTYETVANDTKVSNVKFEVYPDYFLKGKTYLPASGIIKASTLIFEAESTLETRGANAKIQAEYLIGQSRAQIITIADESLVKNQAIHGKSGGQIQVIVGTAAGELDVKMIGEDGKTPAKNFFETSFIPAKGADGVDAVTKCEPIPKDVPNKVGRNWSNDHTYCTCLRPAIAAENGKDGVQGYRGEPGGNGGDAGTLIFHITKENKLELSFNSSPGRGAPGGEGGNGGQPGAPGADPKNHSACPAIPAAKSGNVGKQGDQGPRGSDGKKANFCILLPESTSSDCELN